MYKTYMVSYENILEATATVRTVLPCQAIGYRCVGSCLSLKRCVIWQRFTRVAFPIDGDSPETHTKLIAMSNLLKDPTHRAAC